MNLIKMIDAVISKYGKNSIEANIIMMSYTEDDIPTFLTLYEEFINNP